MPVTDQWPVLDTSQAHSDEVILLYLTSTTAQYSAVDL